MASILNDFFLSSDQEIVQSMASVLNDCFLSSDQDINWFLM